MYVLNYKTKKIRSGISRKRKTVKKCYEERRMTKRKIRKVEMPSMTAERGGRGIGATNRDDDRKSAGFFQYILSTRILIRERIYKSAFSKQIPVSTFQCCGSGCFLTGSVIICADPYLNLDPDPSSSSQNIKKNLDFYCFVTSSSFLYWTNDVNVPSKRK